MDIVETFEPLLRAISDGRSAFKLSNDGKQPSKMHCSAEAFFYLRLHIVDADTDVKPPVTVYPFRADPLEVHVDTALNGLELKFF